MIKRWKCLLCYYKENKIALFFSIKCGSFDRPISNIINELIENKKIDKNYKNNRIRN